MCNVSGYPRSDMSRDMSPMSRTCHKCNNLLQYTTTLITCNITSVNYSLWNIERHRDVSIKVIPKKITVHDHCLPSTQLFIAYNSAKWRNKNLLHGSFTFYNTSTSTVHIDNCKQTRQWYWEVYVWTMSSCGHVMIHKPPASSIFQL